MPRTDFTDQQRAQIFVRDRATCAYSGRSLWIADYGVDPTYQIDWADHVIPAARGGQSVVANGVAAGALYNFIRGTARQRLPLFACGAPTADHLLTVGIVSAEMSLQLRRFRRLHTSDWYLNRAMWHVWISLCFEDQRRAGYSRARDFDYYAGAAGKMLERWRHLSEKGEVPPVEQRGLLLKPLEFDQKRLLEIREARSPEAIKAIMRDLLPPFIAAVSAVHRLTEAQTDTQLKRCIEKMRSSSRIPRRIARRLVRYATAMRSCLTLHL